MKALIAIIAISMAFAGRVSAQNATDVHPMNLAALVGTPENAADLTDPASVVSVQKIQSAKMVQNALIADSMQVAAQKLVTDHADGSTELLRSGSVLELSTTMGGVHSALEQHSITVHVTYDARPVGGILNIRVDLVPVFGGIGSAVRPTISKEFAEAVENFDDDFISQTIMKLTNDLATELAAAE
jgi:cytochrome bd-type quinol oxidase subunit 1